MPISAYNPFKMQEKAMEIDEIKVFGVKVYPRILYKWISQPSKSAGYNHYSIVLPTAKVFDVYSRGLYTVSHLFALNLATQSL